MEKLTVGYLRLSTAEQAQTNAFQNQKERLLEAGAEKIYYDIESGANSERPQLQQMLQDVIAGKISRVIATRWDRLTRDQALYEQIKQIFRESDTEIYLLDQGLVDLKTAAGGLCSDLQVIFAVYERRQLLERTQYGYQKRRDRGAAWARAPWGYIIVNERYEPDPTPMEWCQIKLRPDNYLELYSEPDYFPYLIQTTKAQFAREIFEVVLETRSPAKALNYLRQTYNVQRDNELCPPALKTFPISEQGFKAWLKNPIFWGHTAYLKYVSPSGKQRQRRDPELWDVKLNTHQGIISDDMGKEIQDILATNREKHAPIEKTTYLTGLIFCSSCNRNCSLRPSAGRKYYGCQHASTTCGNRGNVSLPQIDQAIIQALTQKAWQIAQEGIVKPDRLVELEEQYQKLGSISDSGSIPVLQEAQNKLQQQIEQASSEDNYLCQRMLRCPQARKINFWYTLTQEERHIFYRKLVRRVETQGRRVSSVILNI